MLLIDLYELTMAAAYHRSGLEEKPAVFDLFFRSNPFGWGCGVFAGLEPALEHLENLRFGQDELDYLASLALFDASFLAWLGTVRFTGNVISFPEGEIVSADEPLLSVEGPLAQAQIVETALLNIVNFQTLIATKAARIVRAAGTRPVVEFGARRAQGPDGALSATRAAFIGGARLTSHLEAGRTYGIPVSGTQAHSFVMAFDTELEAFRAYAGAFPDHCVLLVDTYDTLASGVPNAIVVARELKKAGRALAGIRLDSGDPASLSVEARRMLDAAGFPEVKIFVSNDLDEHVIAAIQRAGGAIDSYGVGTRLATGMGEEGVALGGVYKLVSLDGKPRIKLSAGKSTIPGRKSVFRAETTGGAALMDVVCLVDEQPASGDVVHDPVTGAGREIPSGARLRPLRQEVMRAGRRTRPAPSLEGCADRAVSGFAAFAADVLDQQRGTAYPVMLSGALHQMGARMAADHRKGRG